MVMPVLPIVPMAIALRLPFKVSAIACSEIMILLSIGATIFDEDSLVLSSSFVFELVQQDRRPIMIKLLIPIFIRCVF